MKSQCAAAALFLRRALRMMQPSIQGMIAVACLAACGAANAQHGPPAVPLVTHNPYFSVWSFDDRLTDGPTRHWTGSAQPMTSLVRIDGHPYRIMGAEPASVPALPQLSAKVAATHTDYVFAGSGVRVELAFFTPAFPQQLDLLSRPVTYLTWTVRATDGKTHPVELMLDVDPVIAVDKDTQTVMWGRSKAGSLGVLSVGSRDQKVLGRSGDNLRIDWGYFHLAAGAGSLVNSANAVASFVAEGRLPSSDDPEHQATPASGAAHLAIAFSLPQAAAEPLSRHVLLAYTEGYAIEYLGERLRPYWQRSGQQDSAMLQAADEEYSTLDTRGRVYDAALQQELEHAGGANYARIAVLAYRQTLAAHVLVADADGKPLFFEKENFSNGCTGTVDVIYPSAPYALFFNPALLEAELEPVLRYASLPRWKFPFAPHDLGQYPLANGQVYGGGEKTAVDQMPVEESGDLVILADALAHAAGNTRQAEKYWPLYTKWALYLRTNGLDPENQLSTDDFAGHLAHNANLSIKAIEALAAYADLAGQLGHQDVAHDYRAAAEQMATEWMRLAAQGDHTSLAFDAPHTWSQKYNLVWDGLLGLKLFPPSLAQSETRFYLKHENKYGLPLDSRKTYTKLDWEVWTATLTGSQADFEKMMAPLGKWLNEGPSRVPLTDWYDTVTGAKQGFQARSVVGGVYIKLLGDKAASKKWQAIQ
jgi:hypothetical protein